MAILHHNNQHHRASRASIYAIAFLAPAFWAAFFIAFAPPIETAFAASGPVWVSLGEDLETTEFSDSSSGSIFPARFTFIRSALKHYNVSVLRAEDFGKKRANVETLCRLSKGSVCINASFFDEKGDPLGLVTSRGIVSRKIHRGGKTLNGVFLMTRSGPLIKNRSDAPVSTALEAIQAGPLLIGNGQAVEGIKESYLASRRSGVCIDKAGRLLFFIATANFSKISIDTIQKLLQFPNIDCAEALNLDGGGSAQLYVNPNVGADEAKYEVLYIAGQDDVPVALSLKLQ